MASEMKICILPACDCTTLFRHFKKPNKNHKAKCKCSQSCGEGNRGTERLSDLLKVIVVKLLGIKLAELGIKYAVCILCLPWQKEGSSSCRSWVCLQMPVMYRATVQRSCPIEHVSVLQLSLGEHSQVLWLLWLWRLWQAWLLSRYKETYNSTTLYFISCWCAWLLQRSFKQRKTFTLFLSIIVLVSVDQ